jgi:hypothetical protein
MTRDDIQAEIDKDPFMPFRLHLVSGNSVDVRISDGAFVLRAAVCVLHQRLNPSDEPGYDLISIRNIERLEQVDGL